MKCLWSLARLQKAECNLWVGFERLRKQFNTMSLSLFFLTSTLWAKYKLLISYLMSFRQNIQTSTCEIVIN